MAEDPAALLDDAIARLQHVRDLMAAAAVPAAITTPDALDRALAARQAVILLDPSLVYAAPLTLRAPVQLVVADAGAATTPVRMTADRLLPRFQGGIAVPADDVTLLGLEVRGPVAGTLVDLGGARITCDRLRVLGDPVHGVRRGIVANGNGDLLITRSIVDDCFGPYPQTDNHDQQAIIAWDMAPGLRIIDNLLRAGTETIMLGGDDSASLERMPADVLIQDNDITKRPEWQTQAISVKNVFEIKAARRVKVYTNRIARSWGGHGQDGYLIMLTVRNQGGKAPWSTIADVVIANNDCASGAAAINVLGRDDRPPKTHPDGSVTTYTSVPLTRVSITTNRFSDLSPSQYTGSPKLIQIGWGPDALTIDSNTFSGSGLTSQVYFQGPATPPCTNLMITNNQWMKTPYGIFASGVANDQQAAWAKYVASGSRDGNVVTPFS